MPSTKYKKQPSILKRLLKGGGEGLFLYMFFYIRKWVYMKVVLDCSTELRKFSTEFLKPKKADKKAKS